MNSSARAGGGHERGRGCDTTSTPHLCAQVALDVIEELCCEMGLQRPEALDEYILFVVTNGGEGPTGSVVPPGEHQVGTTTVLRLPGLHRAERAAADTSGVHLGRGHRDRAPGCWLRLLVPPGGLGTAPQV